MKNGPRIFLWIGVLLLLITQLRPCVKASDPEVWGTSVGSSSLDDDDDNDPQPRERRAENESHPNVGGPQQPTVEDHDTSSASTRVVDESKDDTNDDVVASESSAGVPQQMKPDHVLLVFSNSTSTTATQSKNNKETAAAGENNSKQRLWGSGAHESSTVDPHHAQQQHDNKNNNSDDTVKKETTTTTTTTNTIHIPYVPGRHSNRTHDHHPDGPTRIHPPDGFTLRARVYVDPMDQRTHFDDTPVTLPYYDCGAAGSTTAPLPIAEMYIRHSLSAPTSAYPFSEETLNPVLAVLLQAATLHVSCGDVLELHPGDVVLLEDGLKPGHVLRPVVGGSAGPRAVTVLFLQLPHQHRHIGKEHLSIPTTTTTSSTTSSRRRRRRAPGCPTDAPVTLSSTNNDPGATSSAGTSSSSSTTTATTDSASTESSSGHIHQRPTPTSFLFSTPLRLRRFGLGLVALSVSTLAADFLGRVAPLWLAVGIGGTCFVLGTTYGITMGLEMALAALELRHERRRLQQNQHPPASESSSSSSRFEPASPTTASTLMNHDTATLPDPGAQPL